MMEEEKKDRVTRDCDMWEAAEKQKTAKEHAIQEDSETKEKASSKLRLLSKNLIKVECEKIVSFFSRPVNYIVCVVML